MPRHLVLLGVQEVQEEVQEVQDGVQEVHKDWKKEGYEEELKEREKIFLL